MQTNNAFILRNIYGKYILMPIHNNDTSNDPILLNDMAAKIWQRASMYGDRKSIIDNISQEYELMESSAEITAVDNFISQMTSMGLLLEDIKC